MLQMCRSRNDLNATVFRLRLRRPFFGLLHSALQLQVRLLHRAKRFRLVVMPLYTHYQAAVPVTFGHYLAGIAQAVERDLRGLMDSAADMDRSPLGACAGGGTSAPVDTMRTAELLGFTKPPVHSTDAVASRDLACRILASAAMLAATCSRIAQDFLLWSSAEYRFISFPDRLVGSSSMMPHKRNPFLLEHIQGRGTAAMGSLVAALTSIHATPFTNSVRVSTESLRSFWDALESTTDVCRLLTLVLGGVEPHADRMLDAASQSQIASAHIATDLVRAGAGSFRTIHYRIGDNISTRGNWYDDGLSQYTSENPDHSIPFVTSVALSANYGGGPGTSSVTHCLEELRESLRAQGQAYRRWHRAGAVASARLDAAVSSFLDGHDAPRPLSSKMNCNFRGATVTSQTLLPPATSER
jgi:argininosuccinate lyase